MKARNPVRIPSGDIDCEVNHPKFGWVPFTASPRDIEAHGRELFDRAVAGEFGPVAEYVAPVKTANQLRDAALAALDRKAREARLEAALADPDAPQAVKDYAAALAMNVEAK